MKINSILLENSSHQTIANPEAYRYSGHKATLQPLFNADTVLLLVGGIGITAGLGFVQEFTSTSLAKGETPGAQSGVMKKASRLILAWSAKEMALIEHVKSNFLPQDVDNAIVECSIFHTGSGCSAQKAEHMGDESYELHSSRPRTVAGVTEGRMNVRSVVRSSVEAGLQTAVIVCGPGRMVDEATREVVNCVRDGMKVDLIEETYGW